MNHDQVLNRLAFRYKEPLEFVEKDCTGKEIGRTENIILTETLMWLKKNFNNDEAVTKFYAKVIEEFKPTNAEPFPSIATLKEIKRKYNAWHPSDNEFERIDNLDTRFKRDPDIKYECPEKYKNTSFDIICEDAKKLDATTMLRRYGVALSCKAWYEIALS